MGKGVPRVACLVALCAAAVGCGWLAGPPVFVSVKVGQTNAAEIDSTGKVHMAYAFNTVTDNHGAVSYVYYATGTPGGSWVSTELFDGEGSEVSVDALAIAPDGTIHVLYRRGRIVYHAWLPASGGWVDEVFYDHEAGPAGGIAFDASGGMHVCHSGYKTDTLLADNLRPFYSYKAANATAIQTSPIEIGGVAWADVNHGRESSIVLDSSGRAHIVFGREENILLLVAPKLYYATAEPNGGAVSAAVEIAGGAADTVDNALAIAPDGSLQVAYLGYRSPSDRLKYLSSADGGATWSEAELLDDTESSGYKPRLRVDAGGGLHAAYLVTSSAAGTSVKYAHRPDGASGWTLETADAEVCSGYCMVEVGLTLDDGGSPIIVYPKDTAEGEPGAYLELVVSWKHNGTWVTQTVRDTSLPR